MSETALKRAIVEAIGFRLDGLYLVSVANIREHWSKRMRRTRSHRSRAAWECRAAIAGEPSLLSAPKLEVEICRIAPRPLDDDNLASACKAVRDGIADALGIDDRDPRVSWRYAQAKGNAREYACAITIARVS